MAQYKFTLWVRGSHYGSRVTLRGWQVNVYGTPAITEGDVWIAQYPDESRTPLNVDKSFVTFSGINSVIYFQQPDGPKIKLMTLYVFDDYYTSPTMKYKVCHQDGTWDTEWQPLYWAIPDEDETLSGWSPGIDTYITIADPAIDITLKNASTIQPLTYSLNGGPAVNLNQNTQSGSVTINGDEIITINPILTTRPVTLNGTNIQGVTYGDTTHTQFPTTIPVDVTTTPTLTVNGKPAPEITVDYTNTTEPVIT